MCARRTEAGAGTPRLAHDAYPCARATSRWAERARGARGGRAVARGSLPSSSLMPPRDQTFDLPLGDHTLRVRTLAAAGDVGGHRPTLVLLHDSLGSISVWRDFPERLAGALGCDALLYDRRGYGASSPFGAEPRTPRYLE